MNEPIFYKRYAVFFIDSLHNLKSKSGVQRWNAICEDTTELYLHICRKQNIPVAYTHQEFWQLLFDPPQKDSILFTHFENLCQNETFIQHIHTLLYSLVDPPAKWWQLQ